MAQKPFSSETVIDGFASFEAGVNSGVAPLLLPPNQLAFGTNTTIRGSFATHRPPYNKQVFDFGGDAALQAAVTGGLWQGACYYKPDAGTESLIASISGHLYEFIPGPTGWVVTDVSIPGDFNDPTVTQAWLWQAEKWIIVTDGTTKLPIFYERQTGSRRSIGNYIPWLTMVGPVTLPAKPGALTVTLKNINASPVGSTQVADTYNGAIGPNFTPFVIPPIGGTVVVTVTTQYTGNVGDVVPIGQHLTGNFPFNYYVPNNYEVVAFTGSVGANDVTIALSVAPVPQWAIGTPIQGVSIGEYIVKAWVDATHVTLTRISDVGSAGGTVVATPGNVYPELPAGRMGVYGMGRVWMSLTDGKQFMAGDIVGGPSGTLANNYRDAVLHSSENSYIAGGGYFTTPGSWGDIRAMIFTITLDTSMGQGPLLILTPTRTFSCLAPTDRTTWAKVTNPILTEPLITNGAEGQYSTVTANGDCLFRAVDGIRSLVIGRRDFATWGNVPISSEMDRILSLDTESLLVYGSAIVFDNRLLMTAGPSPVEGRGVFHTGLIALNFDPLSTIRGKAQSVYDGLWSGLNVLQLCVGRFTATERGFAFTYNLATTEIELYEILTTPKDVFTTVQWPQDIEIYDNENIPIVWTGESPVLFKAQDFRGQDFHSLFDGELLVDNLVGTVNFRVLYKPDQYPCWLDWFSWTECAPKTADNSKPQFRPRMGIGQPPMRDPITGAQLCDPTTNRPFREGYTFQVKWIVTGHCRILGARFKANTMPQPQFAKMQCALPESVTVVT